MALAFRLYTLTPDYAEVNPGLTITNEIVPEVLDLSGFEETLELEEGGFRLGNVSVMVRGVAEDYFRGCSDMNAPIVFEATDGSAVWHGPVQPDSVDYDQGTLLTSFTARSWESVLSEVGDVPARSVYETTILQATTANNRPRVFFRWNTPVVVGDVLAIDGPSGEVREVVRAVGTAEVGGLPNLPYADIDAPPPGYPVVGHPTTTGGTVLSLNRITFEFSRAISAIVQQALPVNGSRSGHPSWASIDGNVAQLVLRNVGGDVVSTAPIEYIQYIQNGDQLTAKAFTRSQTVTPAQWAATSTVDLRVEGRILSGNSVRILGADLYGYVPTSNNVSIPAVIGAMLSLGDGNNPSVGEGRPMGILPEVLDAITPVGIPTDGFTLPRVAELPHKPIEALRLLQATADIFFRVVPKIVAGKPRIDINLVSRKHAVDGTPVAAPSYTIKSWSEKGVADEIRAVVVRSNEDYRKPSGDADYAGYWFLDPDGRTPDEIAAIATDANMNGIPDGLERLRYLSVPTGSGVIEVEVATIPAYTGNYAIGGGKKQVVNDNVLKERARTLWGFYSSGTRRFKATLAAGYTGSDYVGKLVSFNQSGFTATVFVTKRTVSMKEGTLSASIEGVIEPDYVVGQTQSPVAVISGSLHIIDPDSDPNVTVVLNGLSSYAPSGEPITYLWERRGLGGGAWTSVGTAVEMTDSVAGVVAAPTFYEYRLTVTGVTSSLAGTDTEVVSVMEASDPTDDPGVPGVRDYIDIQYLNGSGDGEVKLYLAQPDSVLDVLFRSTVGAELTEIDWSVNADPLFWYGDQRLAESGSDVRGLYWTKDTGISVNRLSYIEAYVRFDPLLAVEPLIVRWSFDSDIRANLREVVPTQTTSGQVFVVVEADEDTTAIRIESTYGDNELFVGSYVADGAFEVTHTFLPGETVGITVTAYSGEPGSYVPGDVWSRTHTSGLLTAPTSAEYLTLTPTEQTGSPTDTGTVIFDQDTGDGAGNRAGLQVRHVGGWGTVWDSVNDGTGSGLDADLLDGYDSAAFPRKAEAASISGAWTFATSPVITAAPSGTTQAVRGDRTISTGVSLTGGGNLTANRTLNTIQDIRTTAAPQFARIGLGRAASGMSVDATGIVAADAGFISRGDDYQLLRPDSIGGWARGLAFKNIDGDTTEAGFGIIGTGDAAPYWIAMGFGTTWWGNDGINIRNDGILGTRIGLLTSAPTYDIDIAGDTRITGAVYTDGSGVQVGTIGFASGFGGNGYRISKNGAEYDIEADNLTIRGTFSVYEIIAREISAVNGNLFISANNKIEAFVSSPAATNVIINGSFSGAALTPHYNNVGGAGSSASFVEDTTAPCGIYAMRHISGTASESIIYSLIANAAVAAPGETWTGSIYVKRESGASTAEIYLFAYNDSNVQLGFAASPVVVPTTGQWTRVIVTYTLPAGTTKLSWRLDQNGIGTLRWSGYQVEKAASASAFFEGTIGAGYLITTEGKSKITAGSYVIGQMLAEDLTSSIQFRGKVGGQSPNTLRIETISGTPAVGMTLARYDHATDVDQRGYVYIATSDSGAPFQSIRYGDGDGTWPVALEPLRLGRLSGLSAFTGATGIDRFGIAMGSYTAGWMSARGTSGIEFWQGTNRVGYVDSDGLYLGNAANHVLFNAEFAEFEILLNNRNVISAGGTAGATTLYLGASGTTVRLTGSSIHVDGTTTFASGYSPADVALAADVYARSRTGNLVTNGTGLLGTIYNFPGWTFDGSRTTAGPGSFRTTTAGSRFTTETIPVDPTKTYRLSFDAIADPYTGNRHYSGVQCRDSSNSIISPHHYMRWTGTAITELAAPLNPGDLTIELLDASTWYEGPLAYARMIRFSGYVGPNGFPYPETYSRLIYGSLVTGNWLENGIDGDIITLNPAAFPTGWSGPAYPAGTRVSNATSGSSYQYFPLSNAIVPAEWTAYTGTIGGVHDNPFLAATTKFPPGTASVVLMFLPNYSGVVGAHAGTALNVGNIRFGLDVPERSEFGNVAFEDLIGTALLDNTVIVGGYIRTTLIEVQTLFVDEVYVSGTLYANNATGSGLMFGHIGVGTTPADFGIKYDAYNYWKSSGDFSIGNASYGVSFIGSNLLVEAQDFLFESSLMTIDSASSKITFSNAYSEDAVTITGQATYADPTLVTHATVATEVTTDNYVTSADVFDNTIWSSAGVAANGARTVVVTFDVKLNSTLRNTHLCGWISVDVDFLDGGTTIFTSRLVQTKSASYQTIAVEVEWPEGLALKSVTFAGFEPYPAATDTTEYNISYKNVTVKSARPRSYLTESGITIYSSPGRTIRLGGTAIFDTAVNIKQGLTFKGSVFDVVDNRLFWTAPDGTVVQLS